MGDFDRYSRVDKFEKRRKNTKTLSVLLVVGSILIIVFIGVLIFGGGDEPKDQASEPTNQSDGAKTKDTNTDDTANQTENNKTADKSGESDTKEENVDDPNGTPDAENNNDIETEQIETPDDENVLKAYTGNWQPIGTEQEGPHTVNYNEGTQDRIEMEQAIRLATGLAEGNMTTWWLERGGDQKVIATVSDKVETKTYRAYLTWVDNQGWQPTKVEVLKENDQKYRFE